MITTRYRPDNALRTKRGAQQQRWSECKARPSRFLLVIGLLLLTAPRSPAPVSERLPLFKRTFFTLKGHAVDTFANEQKLPPELDPAFGGAASVLATQPLTELIGLMKKYGLVLGSAPAVLSAGFDGEDRTPEMLQREAAIQRIAKSQLKKIATTPLLPAAGGLGGPEMTLEAFKFPSAFFGEGTWRIEDDRPEELLTKDVKRPNRARIEIPIIDNNFVLSRYATKADIEILRRVSVDTEFKDNPNTPLMRFYADACRGGTPGHLLPMTVSGVGCGGGTTVTIQPPSLQMRVLVLENITDMPINLGQFHFRTVNPGPGMLAVRTRAENEALIASMSADSQPWYKPRVLKPGEKVIVPLELLLKPSHSSQSDYAAAEPATTRASRRASAAKLLADRELQTIAIMYEGKDYTSKNRFPLLTMPKQKFVDALLREPVRTTEKEEFVYGPSIALDSVDVNGFQYVIEPFDPINIAYYSGNEEGSCPFVYTRRSTEGAWLKQGTILTGCSSKAREGTRALQVQAFDGTLRIAEEEDEISYVDELFVRGTLDNGERVTLRPTDDRIAHKDLRYLVLKKGDSVEINFSVPKGMRGGPVEVVASGFFELSPRPTAQ